MLVGDLALSVEDLRTVCEKVLSHLERLGYDTIRLPHDYYWHLDFHDVYDPTKQPQAPSLGSVYDDWDDLSRLLHEGEEALVPDCLALSAIFHAINHVGKERRQRQESPGSS